MTNSNVDDHYNLVKSFHKNLFDQPISKPKNYSMKDIENLEKRVAELERLVLSIYGEIYPQGYGR